MIPSGYQKGKDGSESYSPNSLSHRFASVIRSVTSTIAAVTVASTTTFPSVGTGMEITEEGEDGVDVDLEEVVERRCSTIPSSAIHSLICSARSASCWSWAVAWLRRPVRSSPGGLVGVVSSLVFSVLPRPTRI